MMLRKPWLLVAASIYVLAALPAAAEPALDKQRAKKILESCTASQFVPARGVNLSRDLSLGDTIWIDCPPLSRRRGDDDTGDIGLFEVSEESVFLGGIRPVTEDSGKDGIFNFSGSGWTAYFDYDYKGSLHSIYVDFYSEDGSFQRELRLDDEFDTEFAIATNFSQGYDYSYYYEDERRFDKPRMSAGTRGNPLYLQVLAEVTYSEHSTYTETDGSTVHVLSQKMRGLFDDEKKPRKLVIGQGFDKYKKERANIYSFMATLASSREALKRKAASRDPECWTPAGDPRTVCCMEWDSDTNALSVGLRCGYDEIQGATGSEVLFLTSDVYFYQWLSEDGEYGFVSVGEVDAYGRLREPLYYVECACFETDDDFTMLPKGLTFFAGPAWDDSRNYDLDLFVGKHVPR